VEKCVSIITQMIGDILVSTIWGMVTAVVKLMDGSSKEIRVLLIKSMLVYKSNLLKFLYNTENKLYTTLCSIKI